MRILPKRAEAKAFTKDLFPVTKILRESLKILRESKQIFENCAEIL